MLSTGDFFISLAKSVALILGELDTNSGVVSTQACVFVAIRVSVAQLRVVA